MKRLITLLLFFSLPAIGHSQSIQDIRQNIRSTFQSQKERQKQEFQQFKKKQWENFRVLKGEEPFEKPKVPEPPRAPEKPDTDPKEPVDTPVVKPEDIKRDIPATDPPDPVAPPDEGDPVKDIVFYGHRVKIPYPEQMKVPRISSPSNQSINDAVEKLSDFDFEHTISVLQNNRDAMNLNDWGYYLLINDFARSQGLDKNRQTLLTWYLLSLSGFDTKLAYKNRSLYLFGSVDHRVYQTFYLKEGRKHYFIMDPEGRSGNLGSVKTYRGTYPDSEKSMSYRMQNIRFAPSNANRELLFRYKGKDYPVTVGYNKNRVEFYKNYPQTEFSLYFLADVDRSTHSSILEALSPHVQGKSQEEAVNFLLRFVQTSFAYKTDEQQFGREKPLFLEETIHYPYSDCEDRSILFAYLVQNLLNLKVIGIHYPGHLATAVQVEGDLIGDSVNYRGQKYMIADPTYMGANLGKAMPMYKSSTYSIVRF